MTFYFIPEITLGLLVLTGAYLYAVSPLNPDRVEPVAWPRIAAFVTAAVTLFVTLHPPFDTLAATHFSVHMWQHGLLVFAATPLLLIGLPDWLLAPIFRVRAVRFVAQQLTRLPVALGLSTTAFWIWHMPPLYELALQDRIAHDFEHLTMIVGGLVMWWPVLSRVRAVPPAVAPMQMLYLLLLSIPSGFFSAIFVFANDPLYPTYELARGAEALVDQRIGGLIMKLGGTLVLWTILSVKFIRWLNQRPDVHPASPGPPL